MNFCYLRKAQAGKPATNDCQPVNDERCPAKPLSFHLSIGIGQHSLDSSTPQGNQDGHLRREPTACITECFHQAFSTLLERRGLVGLLLPQQRLEPCQSGSGFAELFESSFALLNDQLFRGIHWLPSSNADGTGGFPRLRLSLASLMTIRLSFEWIQDTADRTT
jgi:hypothetical protein